MSPRILLLQAREPDDPIRLQEIGCFARACEVPGERIATHDLLARPPTLEEIRRHDVLMVGGSAICSVSRCDLPRQAETLEVLRQVAEVGHPVFASCFGFHLFVEALGGELVHDAEQWETGSYPVTLTVDGRRDRLFEYLPDTFIAQVGRHDRATRLPPGAIHLAFSERAPYQAFHLPGRPFWATQFHPELTAQDSRERFLRYRSIYGGDLTEEQAAEVVAAYRESPEAHELPRRFLRLVFG